MSQEREESEEIRKPLDPKQVRNVKILCILIGVSNILCVVLMTVFWSIYDYFIILGMSVLGMAPAFIANAGMTFAGTFRGVGRPMDFGRNFLDGKRLFGKGKTWKGFFGGFLIGVAFSWLVVILVYPPIVTAVAEGQWALVKHVTETELLTIFLQPSTSDLFWRIILLSIGACLGDLIGSFFKRRTGRDRGESFPLVDQLGFVIVAYLLALPFFPMPWYYFLVVCLLTPLIHVLANIVGWYLGKKQVPW
jgi:CDP-2,3-bis-(O-geranylgeranyl)-sn-glycerol synthase